MNGLKRKIFAYYFLLIQLYLIEKLFTLNINIDQCRRQRYSMSNTHFFTAITTTLLLLRNNKLRLILNGIHWFVNGNVETKQKFPKCQ
ncbi:hypothetical protein DERP_007550 [Dermatophagoides pteronyssinus]|uniref:Secreted protein n=1 Tax=Dermatophagoides pteronyssinus TaxID=6956 RepID=A0ABQ8JK21_DERPT|nr:hypothetical protein DERP_007550 [Dermatophagoides pteronyssinus]